MLKKLLFCIFAMTSAIGFAQSPVAGNCYSMDMDQKLYSCYVDFINDNDYYVEVTNQATEDIVYVVVLSYGKYKMDDNQLVLFDELIDYQLILSYSNDTLFVQKGFEFMNEKFFVYSDNPCKTNIPVSNAISKDSIQGERESYNKDNRQLFDLQFGTYKSMRFVFYFSLNEDKTYSYSFRDCPLSNGTWERNGNVLSLYDPSLDCTYYLLVANDNKLISKLLPGDNKGGNAFKMVNKPKPAQSRK